MPFTVNVGPYQGGNFLFQGLSNLGQGIGGGIASATELRRKQQEEQGQSDTIFEEYLKSQKFSDDAAANKEMAAKEALKFHDLSPEGKKGVAAGIIQNWLQRYHVEQIKNMQSEAANRALLAPSEIALRTAEAAKATQDVTTAKAAAPYANTGIWTTDADGNPVQVGMYGPGGDIHTFPGRAIAAEKGGGETKVTRLKDPETKENLPYFSVGREGSKAQQILPMPQVGLFSDPSGATDQLGRYNSKGEWIPISDKSQMMIDLRREMEKPQATTGKKQDTLDSIREQISKAVAAAPEVSTGQPAPSAAPKAQGGYIPGRRYQGMTYLGGDPHDPKNWKQ